MLRTSQVDCSCILQLGLTTSDLAPLFGYTSHPSLLWLVSEPWQHELLFTWLGG